MRATTVLITDACTACGACLVTCPEAVLVAAPGRPAVRDGRCTECLACVEVCPRDAVLVSDQGRKPGLIADQNDGGTP